MQDNSNIVDNVLFRLRAVMRFGGVALVLLVLCAGASSGQWRSTSEKVFAPAPWQASPQPSLPSSPGKSAASARAAAQDVSRRPSKSNSRPAAYDAKVVRTSGDESYVLDPMADEQIAAPEGEPMMINEGVEPDGQMYGDYCDPAMSHPWQGGEYWFNPRHGMPPFLCRYPFWMGFSQSRLWFRGEYLNWWMSGSDTPILTAGESTIHDGPGEMNTESQSGGRASLGWWFSEEQCFGMEINYLGMGESKDSFQGDRSVTGSVDMVSTAEFQSFEFLLRRALIQRCHYRVDFLLGYRYGRLDDCLAIDNLLERDNLYEYETLNEFDGAELGMSLDRRSGRWSYELLMKLGLGRTLSRIDINGISESKQFAVMPEVGLNLMYNITPRTSFTVGYNLLYLSHVARPGDQIYSIHDGIPYPENKLRTTDFWAHGVNLGFDFRF